MARTYGVLSLVVMAALAATASAYPHFWAEEYAPTCVSLPTKPKDCHKAPVVDRTTVVRVLDGGSPTTKICAGKPYTISVSFTDGSKRFAFVTLSSGAVSLKTRSNRRCPNTMSFDRTNPSVKAESSSYSTTVVAPGRGKWTIGVSSATGSCAPFQVTTASFDVTC